MPNVRCTAFFKDDDGHGWSETHDRDGGAGVPNIATILTSFDAVMSGPRRDLLGGDGFYVGCRASYRPDAGGNAGDNLLREPPTRGVQTFLGTIVNMPRASDAVKVRIRNAAATAHTDIYLRGIWRQVIIAGVLDFTTTPEGVEWKRRCDIYVNALIQAGYGWVGIDPGNTVRGRVTGYTRNPLGTVTLNLTRERGGAIPVAGTKVVCEFARINHSKSVMNSTYTCVVDTGAAAVTTTEVIALDDFASEGTFILKATGLVPYSALSYYKLSGRKTGRPFGLERGRSRVRVLH
jgi:hypothetical protein